jgi:hypothetical protein
LRIENERKNVGGSIAPKFTFSILNDRCRLAGFESEEMSGLGLMLGFRIGNVMRARLSVFFLLVCCLLSSDLLAEKAKIVFMSGKPSHGPMSHEHRAGNMILAKRLNQSGLDRGGPRKSVQWVSYENGGLDGK